MSSIISEMDFFSKLKSYLEIHFTYKKWFFSSLCLNIMDVEGQLTSLLNYFWCLCGQVENLYGMLISAKDIEIYKNIYLVQ